MQEQVRATTSPVAGSLRQVVRDLSRRWHARVGRAPRPLAEAYLRGLGAVSRQLPYALGVRIWNSAGEAYRSAPRLPAQTVTVGQRTRIRIVPHLGEFYGQALFTRRLDYEVAVFSWLETALADYDLVIEIGANVGIYTAFMALTLRGAGHGRVIAFEPSPEAARRLRENLRINGAEEVTVHEAAVGDSDGHVSFFEPEGHLTNGSFLRDFAGIFSKRLHERQVLCWDAGRLSELIRPHEVRVLLKIDVEGYEPRLLRALEPVVRHCRPDLLIEVLEKTPEALADIDWLRDYRACILTAVGPTPREHITADPIHRDWLLRPKP